MATIAQIQQLLTDKARKLALERSMGLGLITRIEQAGGKFSYDKDADSLKFFNVPEELKEELENKLKTIGFEKT